jgi:transcription elongation factor Elf1
MINEKFTCPKCGSHHWGSSRINEDFSKWLGYCHGYKDGVPCDFIWSRTEDSKYFESEINEPPEGGTA